MECAEGEPRDARHRLFEAVAAAIGHAARRRPVLLVVEDLHWADPATLRDARARDPDGGVGPASRCRLAARRAARQPRACAFFSTICNASGGSSASCSAACPRTRPATWPPRGWSWDRRPRRSRRPSIGAREATRSSSRSLSVTWSSPIPAEPVGALIARAGTDVPRGVRAVIDRRLARLTRVRRPGGEGRGGRRRGFRARGHRRRLRHERRCRRRGAGRGSWRGPGGRVDAARAVSLRPRAGPRGGARGADSHSSCAAAPADGRGARVAARRAPRAPAARARAAPARRPAAGRRGQRCERRAAGRRAGDAEAGLRGRRRVPRTSRGGRPRRTRPAARGGPTGPRGRPAAVGRRAVRRPLLRRGCRRSPAPSATTSCSPGRRSGPRA